MIPARWTAAALAAGVAGGAAMSLIAASPAAAVSCTAITIAQGQGLTFDVSSVLVTTGGCVRFANLTDVTVTVTVSGSSFSERLPAKTPASASRSFVATRSAGVTATDGVRTGHGSITVEKPVSTPTYVPPPVESVAPTPTPSKSSVTPSTTPSDSATPTPHRSRHSAAAALPALPSLPTGGADAPQAVSHPVVAPRVKGSTVARTATALEPSRGPRRGLPAAVALVSLLGLLAAYGRTVLAAAPAVDGGTTRRPSHP